jgi:hypothetical protein
MPQLQLAPGIIHNNARHDTLVRPEA